MSRPDHRDAAEIVLYDGAGLPSPRRVRLCLIEKRLPFTIKWLNVGLMDQKRPVYLLLNPTGMVPTMVHRGEVLFDSNVINEFLDATYPHPPLVPGDALGLAQMRMWFAFEGDFAKPFRDAAYETTGKARLQNAGLSPETLRDEIVARTSNPAYLRFATRVLLTPPDHEVLADRMSLLLEKLEGLESALADGRSWLCGDRFTLADIAVGPRIDLSPTIGLHDLYERHSRIAAWMERLKARPSWAQSAISPLPGETERVVPAEDLDGRGADLASCA